MISSRTASLISAIAAVVVVLTSAIVAAIVAVVGEEGPADLLTGTVFLLALGLVTFGLVLGSVRLALHLSRSKVTQVWVAIVIPLASLGIAWFLPTIPFERFGDRAFAMFAISHPTLLAEAIVFAGVLVEVAGVLVATSFAMGWLSRRKEESPTSNAGSDRWLR